VRPVRRDMRRGAAQPALAGTKHHISGTAKGRDAVALDRGPARHIRRTRIGAPLPRAGTLDDVTVTADTLHTVLKENFETSSSGLPRRLATTGSSGAAADRPTGANSGMRCAATTFGAPHQQLADCVLQSPTILSLAFSASLSYYEWFDIAKQDSLISPLERSSPACMSRATPRDHGSQTYCPAHVDFAVTYQARPPRRRLEKSIKYG